MTPRRPTPLPYHTVTPRIVVGDVDKALAFLRAAFDVTGNMEPGRPAEVHTGDSTVLVSSASERTSFPAFLYEYVDDADAAYRRAVEAGAETMEEPSTRLTATGGQSSVTSSATCTRSRTAGSAELEEESQSPFAAPPSVNLHRH